MPVIGVFDEKGGWIAGLGEGQEGYVALPRTPFYLESGGQVSDQGRLFGADGSEATVQRMVRRHFQYTRSKRADDVLRKWETYAPRFVKVFPRDYKRALGERIAAESGNG